MDPHQQFLELFLHHQHDLRAFVASAIRDWHRSEDVIQELASTLWEKFDRYDRARPFGAWARGVAANLILRDFERHRRALPLLSPEALQAVLAAYDQPAPEPSAEQEALRRCLQRLSERARRLVDLRYERALPLEDLAREDGGSLAAVKKALSRIRSFLHDCVGSALGRAGGDGAAP